MSQRGLPITRFQSLMWSPKRQVSTSVGPYNFKSNFFDWHSDYREGSITFTDLSGTEARVLIAFLDSVGLTEPFLYQDEQMLHPRGFPSGTGTVKAGQTGDEIVTEGWDPETALFEPGDQVVIKKRLFTVLEQAVSDANGEATLILWPSVNSAYIGGTPVKYGADAKALFVLTEFADPVLTSPMEIQGLTISIREAIASGYIDFADIADPEAPVLEKQPGGVIKVSWAAYTMATGYEVWHSYNSGTFEQLDTLNGGTFELSHTLNPGETGSHSYKLRAIIPSGTTGYSAITSASVTDWDYLPRPVITVAKNVSLAFDIDWSPYDEVDWNEVAMQVWCSFDSGGYGLVATESPLVLGGRHSVGVAGSYTYRVRVVFSNGQFSPWSLEASGILTQAEINRATVIGMRCVMAGSYQFPVYSLHADQIPAGLSLSAGIYQAPKTYLRSEPIPVNFTLSGSYETA